MSKEKKILEECIKLMESKGNDYNSAVKLDDYFPHGLLSYHQMLHVKVKRMESLITSGAEVKHESMRDTLIDLINYSVFTIKYLDEQNNVKRKPRG